MALSPIYKRWDPQLARWEFGLSPGDWGRVTAGYACGNCLEEFAFYTPRCTVCGHTRDLERDLFEEPDYWKPNPNDPDRRAA